MKPETQGKLMVAMLVSIMAFGFGTGTVMVTGHLNSNPSITPNTTQQSEFPTISNSADNYSNSTSSNFENEGYNYPSNKNNNSSQYN
ncbi:MAG: hypothetical protein LLF83_07540 [Methanobacterium sp.]|nr:hypothetical protein [Methanobacterium sp.]